MAKHLFASGDVEPVRVHDLVPRGHEVGDELRLIVVLRVNLGVGPELRVGTEHEVHAGGRPLDVTGRAVAHLEGVLQLRRGLHDIGHVEQVDEEVIGQRLGLGREHAGGRLAVVGIEHAQTTDEHGHFGRGEAEELRLVDQEALGHAAPVSRGIIAETIGHRFEMREAFDVGLLLRGIREFRAKTSRLDC